MNQQPARRGARRPSRPTVRILLGLALLAVPVAAGPAVLDRGSDSPRGAGGSGSSARGLDDPAKKEIAMQLVASAENSTLDWRAQYPYIEDIGDGRGYTAGIIGFCSGTGDMLELVERHVRDEPDSVLARYVPALRAVNGTDSHEGLGPAFERDWRAAARTPAFQRAQDGERDRVYFDPAVRLGKSDRVGVLGQFIYFDALVMHGPGEGASHFGGIRESARAVAPPPSEGGDERAWLHAFLDARVRVMRQEEAHSDTSRVDTAQRKFLDEGNLGLDTPLDWKVYGDSYHID